MNKYKLTEETSVVNGITLRRIKAIKDFGDVSEGDLGGYLEDESNLSQYGDAWVYGDAKVYGYAKVYGDAKVYGNAWVSGNAWVYGDAEVSGGAEVYCDAKVSGNAKVYSDAKVYGDAKVSGGAEVYGDAKVSGNAWVSGDAEVYGNAWVSGGAEVSGNADYIIFKNWWSSGRYFTWTRSNNMWRVGCFYGTGDKLIEKAYKDSDISGREYERAVRYVEEILKDYK